MIGAIVGDVVGSAYEGSGIKSLDLPLFRAVSCFTDDTVLTVAIADALISGAGYAEKLREWYAQYPDAGYGRSFRTWAQSPGAPAYGSWGNGSAMRVSPVAYAFDAMDAVLAAAQATAAVTHDHEEGIRGAQATAAATFIARTGGAKDDIRDYVESAFGYDLRTPLEVHRALHRFDVSCQGSVPPSIIAFLESTDYESAVRNAISLGGDADTMACIAGAIAEPFYRGVPTRLRDRTMALLDRPLLRVIDQFMQRYRPSDTFQLPTLD